MMCRIIRNIFSIALVFLSINFCSAQGSDVSVKENPYPFRILTSGKQVTVKATKNIKSIMVWTASGHRIIEQKQVNASSFNFKISVNEKVFFVMLQLADGKIYSEKIGVR
jgi:hypothetical protein